MMRIGMNNQPTRMLVYSWLHAAQIVQRMHGLIIHSNVRHPIPHPSRHENQPGLLVF